MTNEQALENCRLFAARHRAEDWAKTILRFCNEGGATGSPLRAALASQVVQEPVAYRFTHNRGNGRTAYTYHDNTPENNWRTAYRDTCLSIEPLYAAPVAAGEPQTQSPAPVVQVVEPLTEEEIIELRKNQSGRYGFAGLQPYGDTLQLSAAVQLACARKWGLTLKENT